LDAEAGPLVMGVLGKQEHPAPVADKDVCIHCGRAVTWRNSQGQGFCTLHEADAREREADDQKSAPLVADMLATRAANPAPTAVAENPPAQTDLAALFREILFGLESFLSNSEWTTIRPVQLTPIVTLGAKDRGLKPRRIMIGPLRDVVLQGITELLSKHGSKIWRCEARNCQKVFVEPGKQIYCSPKCREYEKQERFKEKLKKKESGPKSLAEYHAERRQKRLHTWHGPNRQTSEHRHRQSARIVHT
jgi:hypothetical protein